MKIVKQLIIGIVVLVLIIAVASAATAVKQSGTPQPHSTPAPAVKTTAPQHFSGNGTENLGVVTITTASTLTWTDNGGFFAIYAYNQQGIPEVPVNSQGSSGTSVLAAGTYPKFQINAIGNWTITIK